MNMNDFGGHAIKKCTKVLRDLWIVVTLREICKMAKGIVDTSNAQSISFDHIQLILCTSGIVIP